MKGVVMYVNELKNQHSKPITDSNLESKRKCIKTEWYTRTVKMLQLAGKSEATQRMYARSVRQLIEFYNKEPTEITEKELEEYFLHRRNVDKWSPATLKVSYAGLKFFYQNILIKDWHILKILKAQPEKRLPCILSREEVYDVLSKVKKFHNYTFFFTVYSLGLRLQEGLNLQVTDIDSKRMQVHIHRGKGAKDRYIPLPEDTLKLLRKYWKMHKHSTLLFPGYGKGGLGRHTAKCPMDPRGVQRALRAARFDAGIIKRHITVHTLRHASATHMLDEGINIKYIQQFLGHSCLDTTLIYLHLTKKGKEDAYEIINKIMREKKNGNNS